jgi:hypothetical protein
MLLQSPSCISFSSSSRLCDFVGTFVSHQKPWTTSSCASPIFSNNSCHPQTPTYIQLAIALFRFGHHGNAASVESIAQWAGVSAGVIMKCTRRVIVAFLSMHDSVIQWPTKDEKDEAKAWVESVSCEDWAGGFCMVDGTLIPLFEKPRHHGEVYFDRKSNYSLNVQVCPYHVTSLIV